ncbi:MAG: methylmalonyl Co-A mutase-associated GTPase MeaB, partial [Myroides sp.]
WQPKVLLASAFYNQGIEDVWQLLEKYFSLTRENGYFETNRKNQNAYWLKETINERLLSNFYQNQTIYDQLQDAEKAVQNNEKSPFTAANELLELYESIVRSI